MKIMKSYLFLIILLLIACEDTEIKKPLIKSNFNVITAYGNSIKFDILYDSFYLGNFSYIVSVTELNITSETEFNASTATKTNVTITSDNLSYNNYYSTGTYLSGTTYYIYILDRNSGHLSSFIKTTGNTTPYTSNTGTLSDGTSYTLYFPAEFTTNPTAIFPLLVSIKAPNFLSSNSHFPCIVFSTNHNYTDTTAYNNFCSGLRSELTSIITNASNRIDINHLYIIGFSAGGCAAVDVANNDGSASYQFTAIAAVGISDWLGYSSHSANLGNTDIWLFYGEDDIPYGVNGTRIAYYGNGGSIPGIPRTSGDHFLTEMPGIGHSDSPVWISPYTLMWLLSK